MGHDFMAIISNAFRSVGNSLPEYPGTIGNSYRPQSWLFVEITSERGSVVRESTDACRVYLRGKLTLLRAFETKGIITCFDSTLSRLTLCIVYIILSNRMHWMLHEIDRGHSKGIYIWGPQGESVMAWFNMFRAWKRELDGKSCVIAWMINLTSSVIG